MILDLTKRKSIKIRTGILSETIVILITTVFTLITYTYYSNTKALIEQSELIMNRSTESLQKQISQTLHDAENVINMYAPLIQQAPLENVLTYQSILSTFGEALNAYSPLTSIYFGTQSGVFFEISTPLRTEAHLKSIGLRLPENTTSVIKIIDRSQLVKKQKEDQAPDEVSEDWHFVNEQKEVSSQNGQKTKYDHRKRGWYKASIQTSQTIWSDIYIFASTLKNEAGITVSKALYKDSKIVGVLATDLTVTTFSEFLEKSKVSEKAQAYIIDDKERVLSTSTQMVTSIMADGQLEQIKISNTTDTVLKEAHAEYLRNKGKESIIFFKADGKEYIGAVNDFPKIINGNWKAINIAPLEDFIGKIAESKNRVLFFSLIIILLEIVLAFRLAQRISKPIIQLAKDARDIRDLKLDTSVKITTRIQEIQELADSMMSLRNSMKAFSYYIPRSLVQKLLQQKGAIHVGGRAKEITIMFSDIEGFTNISEKITAENLVHHLSEYFEDMSSILIEHNATIDKFIGDAIMAFWGAPIPDRHHAYNACHAALLCQKKLKQQNLIWKRGEKPAFPTRIGIHTGNVVVGNIGSSERMNYTAIGDNINFAARLEGINKYYGTYILISEAVYDHVKGKFLVRTLDKIAVKGKAKAVKVYELVAQISGDDTLLPDETQEAFVQHFEKAYHLYLTRQFQEALEAFTYIEEKIKVGDQSVHIYLDRCQEYLKEPPPHEWDGSYKLDKKY